MPPFTTVTCPLMISYLKILLSLELLSQVKNQIHPFLQSQFPSSKCLVCFNGAKILPDLNLKSPLKLLPDHPHLLIHIQSLGLKSSLLGHKSLPLSFCSQTLWRKECGKVYFKKKKAESTVQVESHTQNFMKNILVGNLG